MKWQECLRRVEVAEREYVRRQGGRTTLREMSPIATLDAANEDPQGRLPFEPGYGTGADVIELPPSTPRRPVVVGDIFAVLRELGARASRGR